MAFGRLERRTGEPPMSDINMTPLIDVMLVLVVIFIITAPLLASTIRLELPRTDAATPGDAHKAVLVVLDPAGRLFLDDKATTRDALAAQLARIAAQNPEAELQLRADAGVPYGKVVEIMGLAQKAGLGRIGFVAEPRPAP